MKIVKIVIWPLLKSHSKNYTSATPIKIFFSLLKAGELKASWKKAKVKLKASERQAKNKLKGN